MTIKLKQESLWSLEHYSKIRKDFRIEVLKHKKNRRVALGDHITLTFEDKKTVRYQVQEMLRIEKTFDASGIQDELEAYNPLIPDGKNFKCTMMIEQAAHHAQKAQLEQTAYVWPVIQGSSQGRLNRRRGAKVHIGNPHWNASFGRHAIFRLHRVPFR